MLSTGSYLPGDPITNEEIDRYAGRAPGRGARGDPGQDPSLDRRPRHGRAERDATPTWPTRRRRRRSSWPGSKPDDVDLLVVSTASPEYHLPPTATFVQEKLGQEKIAAMDIRSGCAGAVEALDLARMYLERGQYDTARRDRQRGDLAADRPGLPGHGAQQGADARQARHLQLRRRRRRDGAPGGRRRRRRRRARLGDRGIGGGAQGRHAGGRRRHARADPRAARGQAPGRAQGGRRRERALHPLRAHRGPEGDAERAGVGGRGDRPVRDPRGQRRPT